MQPLTEAGVAIDWFSGDEEPVVAKFVFAFFDRYGTLPSEATVLDKCGVEFEETADPIVSYIEALASRAQRNQLRDLTAHLMRSLSDSNLAPVVEQARSILTSLSFDTRKKDLHSSRQLSEELLADYRRTASGGGVVFPTDWKSFDRALDGGLRPGDLLAVVGRIGLGKSQLLICMAHSAWAKGKKVMFLSFEMPVLQVYRRFFALHSGIPYNRIKGGKVSGWAGQYFEEQLEDVAATDRLNIVMAGLDSNVSWVRSLVAQHRPDILILDGGGMLKPAPGRFNAHWERIAATAQDLRTISLTQEIPIVASYHFNRKVSQGATQATMEKIAGADEIGRLATIVLSIFRRNYKDKIATLNTLKGREGEWCKFDINFDFDRMDFSEIEPPEEEL